MTREELMGMTLEELMIKKSEIEKQKSEIEKQIRAKKDEETVKYGMVMVDVLRCDTKKPGVWRLRISKSGEQLVAHHWRWYTVIDSADRKIVIDTIQKLIEDLTGLMNELKKEVV